MELIRETMKEKESKPALDYEGAKKIAEDLHNCYIFIPSFLKDTKQGKTTLKFDLKSRIEAMAGLILVGDGFGLSPQDSLVNIVILKGKVCLPVKMMYKMCYSQIEMLEEEFDCSDSEGKEKPKEEWKCTIKIKRKNTDWWAIGQYTYSDAVRSGSADDSNKFSVFNKYPKLMMHKDALKYALLKAFPDILGGVEADSTMREVINNEKRTATETKGTSKGSVKPDFDSIGTSERFSVVNDTQPYDEDIDNFGRD